MLSTIPGEIMLTYNKIMLKQFRVSLDENGYFQENRNIIFVVLVRLLPLYIMTES